MAIIVGTGGIGRRHAQNLRARYPNIRLICVRDAPTAITEELGMACVPDIDAALGEQPNLAVIALPPALQAEVAARVLDASVPLYLEKPAAVVPGDLDDTVAAAEAKGVTTMIGCHLRQMPGIRRIAGMLSDGTLGVIRSAHLSVGQWLPDWRPGRDYRQGYAASRALGGGVLLDLVHEFDLAQYFFGDLRVDAARAGQSGALEIETEDWADVWLRSAEGCPVSIHLDYLDRAGHRGGRIIGSEGSLAWDVLAHTFARFEATDGSWQRTADAQDFDGEVALRTAMTEFVDCVEAGRPTSQPISGGLTTVAIAHAARRATGLVT